MKNNIKSERVRAGFTQEELAAHLSVDESTISKWENGKTSVPSGKAIEMSKLFTCSIDYLFGVSLQRVS